MVFERHVAEPGHDAPVVPILAAPLPQLVDQLDVLKVLGMHLPVLPEQVIEVPSIWTPSRCSRTVLSAPQMAEQLVEVPTLLSVAVLQQRTAEQLASIPVPRGRHGRLPGSLPGQGSTVSVAEQTADSPSSSRDLHGFRPRQSSISNAVENHAATEERPLPRLKTDFGNHS